MATKQELITGVEMVIQEARRVSKDLTDAQWESTVDLDGWRSKQVLAHVGAIGTIVVPFVTSAAAAEPGTDSGAGMDIDALNAALVGARADKTIPELVAEIETGYRGIIDHIGTMSDDALAKKTTVRGYRDVPLGDLMMRMIVLHGLAHIYSAYAGVFATEDVPAGAR